MLNCAAGWGNPNLYWQGSESTTWDTYLRHIPLPMMQWLPDADIDSFPIPSYQDGWMRPLPKAFQPSNVSCLALFPAELSNWLRAMLHPFVSVGALNAALTEPHLLMRLAYKTLPSIAEREGTGGHGVYAALTSFGAAFHGIGMFFCKYCFRRVTGNMSCCNVHSQAKLVLRLKNTTRSHQFIHKAGI